MFADTASGMPEAIPVFDDPYAITIADDESDTNEQRSVALGIGAAGRLLCAPRRNA